MVYEDRLQLRWTITLKRYPFISICIFLHFCQPFGSGDFGGCLSFERRIPPTYFTCIFAFNVLYDEDERRMKEKESLLLLERKEKKEIR